MRRHGRAKAGNVASSMALDCFVNIITDKLINFKDADEVIGDIVDANKAIYTKSLSNSMYSGMVRPLSLLLFRMGCNSKHRRQPLLSYFKQGIQQITKAFTG